MSITCNAFLEAVLRCKIQIYFLQPQKHYDNIHWAPEMLVRESHSYHTGCKILYTYLHCEQLCTALYGRRTGVVMARM